MTAFSVGMQLYFFGENYEPFEIIIPHIKEFSRYKFLRMAHLKNNFEDSYLVTSDNKQVLMFYHSKARLLSTSNM